MKYISTALNECVLLCHKPHKVIHETLDGMLLKIFYFKLFITHRELLNQISQPHTRFLKLYVRTYAPKKKYPKTGVYVCNESH